MGFEQDYEKGLRDKHWGRTLQRVAKGCPAEDIGKAGKSSLCADLREMAVSGEQSSINQVFDLFVACARSAFSERSLFLTEECRSAAMAEFHCGCAPILHTEEHSGRIELAHCLALEHLEDVLGSAPLAEPAVETARQCLQEAFLHDVAKDKMRPAGIIAAQKHKIGPASIDALLEESVAHMQLPEIAARVISGKGKELRAPASSLHYS